MNTSPTPFPVESFAPLAAAEANYWWFRGRNRVLLWVLQHKVPVFHTLLELGCGTGYVLEAIRQSYPQIALYGSDFFEENEGDPVSYKFRKILCNIPLQKNLTG
jgi:hypothetical protein